MMISKSVYCIIVTYNGMKWIDKCLTCLENSEQPLKIIIIDNGSTDGTVAYIENAFPKIQIIKTGKNLGFGQGNNMGLKIAVEEKADHILLINQDAYINSNTVSTLVQQQSSNPQYGILSPVHMNGNGTNLDDHFFYYLQKSPIQNYLYQSLLQQSNDATIIETPFVNAAAWLISRECLIKTGGFDPIFFHYGEDDNYAQRVKYKGFKSGIYTGSIVYHDNDRPPTPMTLDKRVKKDWIILLNHFCDINHRGYKKRMIKKLIRHNYNILAALLSLNISELQYNYTMSHKIITHFGKIKESRNQSIQNKVIPHL